MVTRETSLIAGLSSLGLTDLFVDPSEVVRSLARFSESLATDGVKLGLVGPREIERIVERHVLDSAALLALISLNGLLVDVGSGAGLPGLVLAILRQALRPGDADSAREESRGERAPSENEDAQNRSSPDPMGTEHLKGATSGESAEREHLDGAREARAQPESEQREPRPGTSADATRAAEAVVAAGSTTLIEPKAKAAAFLRRIVGMLGVDCSVLEAAAETVARSSLRETADSVVARALAPLSVSLELTLPLTRVGGRVLLPIGGGLDAPSSDSAARACEELGGGEPALLPLEVPGAEAARWVMIIEKARSTPERYPRRPAALRRRPLGGSGVT